MMLILLITSIVLFNYNAYLLLSFTIIALTMIPFYARFEIRKISSKEIVILAILAAIAAVSRVPFAPLPSVQPTSFVIIVTGLVFGAESGFIIGAVAAIVSNIFLGQGPWTPWQMFSWGLIGLSAVILRKYGFMKKIWFQCLFGFVWGFLFGWIMNLWIITSNVENLSWEFVIGIYISSFRHDLAHALANVFFIAVFSTRWVKILHRFKRKYGLLDG